MGKTTKTFDDLLIRIGEFGKAQIFFYILVGLCGIPTGEQNLSSIFVGGNQDYWCKVAALKGLNETQQLNIGIPKVEKDGKMVYSKCEQFDINFGNFSDLNSWNRTARSNANTSTKTCSKWTFSTQQFTSTIKSQFVLTCDKSFLVQLVTTIYMAGFMTGCVVFGAFSDKFGRLKTVVFTATIHVVFGVTAALVPSLPVYIICRFLVGTAAAGCFTTSFVIVMEIIGPKWRMATGIFVQGWFALGFIILTALAYFIRNHVTLQLVIAIPPLLLISYYWIVPESPRWLNSQGRYEETNAICHRIANMNKKELEADFDIREYLNDKSTEIAHGNLLDLVKTPNMRKRSLNIFFNWFVNSLVYYGLSLNTDKLPGTLYFNTLLSAAVEFPSYIACCFLLDRFGRKPCLVGALLIGGIPCIICAFMQTNEDLLYVLITLAMLGKAGISASFAIIYVYTAEVLPTTIRNVGVGVASTHARIGALVAPQIALLSRIWSPLPFLICGALAVAAGLLALLLPETLHRTLPETIEDGERFGQEPPISVEAETGELLLTEKPSS